MSDYLCSCRWLGMMIVQTQNMWTVICHPPARYFSITHFFNKRGYSVLLIGLQSFLNIPKKCSWHVMVRLCCRLCLYCCCPWTQNLNIAWWIMIKFNKVPNHKANVSIDVWCYDAGTGIKGVSKISYFFNLFLICNWIFEVLYQVRMFCPYLF